MKGSTESINDTSCFKKRVSSDEKSICTKAEKANPEVMAIFDQEYDKHESLMERLKDL